MKLVVNPDLNNITWERLTELYSIVEWGHRTPEEIKISFEASAFTCFVFVADELVGFGRTVDDGKYYALIVDVVVAPEYQEKGIGKNIVTTLKDNLKGYLFVTLTAAPGKSGFYEKLNWKKQKSAYIWPLSEKQSNEHCEL